MISQELLEKYYMKTLEGYKEDFGDSINTERMFYDTLLKQTDHIPLKIFEGSLSSVNCVEELEAREYSRMKLAELNGDEYTPKVSKNIEERTTEIEIISTNMLGAENNKDQASEQFRKALQMFVQTLTDDNAMEVATVFPPYVIGKNYEANEMFTFGENGVGDPQLYRVVKKHTSQADWIPSEVTSLYTPIGLNDEGYPTWSQPTGAHDAYGKGDIVDYNGTLYISTEEVNTWSPDVYGWEKYTE